MGGDHLWDAIGAIGEVLGAIGVIATLGYLALQIRRNTQAQRSSSRLDTTRALSDFRSMMAADSELVRLFSFGFEDPSRLSEDERSRFLWIVAAFTSRVDEMYSQYEAGLIEDELWSQYREVMAGILANSAVKEWWDSGAAVFSTNFRKEIDTTAPDQRWDAESLRVLRTAGPRE